MADDARTEARRRIAAAVRPVNPSDTGVFASADEIADAVLDLFPEVAWSEWIGDYRGPLPPPPEVVTSRQLALRGPVEPVTKESPDAA